MRPARQVCLPQGRLFLGFYYWASIVCLFVIVHATQDRLADLARLSHPVISGQNVEAILSYAPRIKGILFLLSTAILAAPIVQDGYRLISQTEVPRLLTALAIAVATELILLLLVLQPGNASMGEGYATRSVAPFSQDASWYHQRLLMPAMAHVLFFRGGWLYYAFGLMTGTLLVALIFNWLKGNAPVPMWQLVSLSTASFVIFQFQFPGYPDVLAFCFFVAVMTTGWGQSSKLSFLVLALLTHEASAVMGVLLAFRYLDRRHLRYFLAMLLIYGVVWLGSMRFDAAALVGSRNVDGISALEWVLQRPSSELLGIFIGYKAAWLLVAVALAMSVRQRQWRDAAFVGVAIAVAILMTFFGVDTSRLVGFAFPMVLVAILIIQREMTQRGARRFLSVVLSINLLIPSIYVGLNTSIRVRPGLYGLLFEILQSAGNVGKAGP